MKAAVYYKNSDIRVEDVPDISVDKGEIKVKVKSCGVCGSDIMEWYRITRAGRPAGIGAFGHECSGDIIEIGEDIESNWKIGDRVVVTHHVPCGSCPACLSGHTTACDMLHTTKFKGKYGAYADYVVLPPINVEKGILKLPDSVTYDEATFVEPLGCVLRGQRWAKVSNGKSVLIIGAGLSGLLHCQTAQVNGAGFIAISDINKNRLDLAKKFGANGIIDANTEDVPKKFKELNGGLGADVVIMTAPIPICVKQSLEAIAPGGTILFFAPTKPEINSEINIWDLWQNEITITHSYGAAYKDLYIALKWIENGRINVKDMITDIFPLEETSKGFMITAQPEGNSLKAIIHPED